MPNRLIGRERMLLIQEAQRAGSLEALGEARAAQLSRLDGILANIEVTEAILRADLVTMTAEGDDAELVAHLERLVTNFHDEAQRFLDQVIARLRITDEAGAS